MSDFKDLIRFQPILAVQKARTTIEELMKKYENKGPNTADEYLADAVQYNMASKAARYSIMGEDIVCNLLIPGCMSMLKHAVSLED